MQDQSYGSGTLLSALVAVHWQGARPAATTPRQGEGGTAPASPTPAGAS